MGTIPCVLEIDSMKYIFVHGMGQNASSWDKTIACLNNGIQPICLELSDFFTEESCDYQNLYSRFCDYCNQRSEPLNLCGLSLGAVLVLNYAIEFPERIKSLVLIAPQYDMPKFLLKVQNVVFRLMPESQFKNIGLTKKDFLSLTNSMMDLDFTDKLVKISCPVLILCGKQDHVNKKVALKISENILNVQFCMIDHSGHEVNVDNPKELAHILNEFICQE